MTMGTQWGIKGLVRGVVMALLGMGTGVAWANPQQKTTTQTQAVRSAFSPTTHCFTDNTSHNTSHDTRHNTRCEVSRRAAGTDAQIQQNVSSPAQPFPAGAWTLESVSAAVAGVGFIMIGVGMSFLTQRTTLVNKASDPLTRPDNIALARDIRSLEDTGTGLYVAGFVAAGVGLVGMVVGAIWLLTHRPTPPTLPVESSAATKNQTLPSAVFPSSGHTLLIRE